MLKKQLNTIMIKREVTISGITYTVRATTLKGVEDGIKMLKRALKQTKKTEDKDGI
jgi:hypothetical protein